MFEAHKRSLCHGEDPDGDGGDADGDDRKREGGKNRRQEGRKTKTIEFSVDSGIIQG